MITIYKKIEKNINCPSGICKIEDIQSLDKPFLLCLSAQNNHDKSIYGIMREGASISRVYTTNEEGARYKIDDFPVDFLGLRYQKDGQNRKNYEEIVDDFLYPYLITNSHSVEDIIKRARKINFMTYCDGTETYLNIENRLISKLEKDNIKMEDITKILSQISLTAVGTMIDTSTIKATCATFIDVNDSEISTSMTEDYKKAIEERNRKGIYGTIGKNIVYIYNGNGNHDLKEYFKNDNAVKPVIAGTISYFLERSIKNDNISLSEVIEGMNIYANEMVLPIELMGQLDDNLSYGTSKYTKEEIKLRQELDVVYKSLYEIQKSNQRMQDENNKYKKALSSVINGVRDNCTEMTFLKILSPSGLWQAPANVDYINAPSDKELLENKSKIK